VCLCAKCLKKSAQQILVIFLQLNFGDDPVTFVDPGYFLGADSSPKDRA